MSTASLPKTILALAGVDVGGAMIGEPHPAVDHLRLSVQFLHDVLPGIARASSVRNDGTRPLRLPDLTRKLSVSRETVRRALSRLAEEGLLLRVKGSGTYINKELTTTRGHFRFL